MHSTHHPFSPHPPVASFAGYSEMGCFLMLDRKAQVCCAKLCSHTYTIDAWTGYTGKPLDGLWADYVAVVSKEG